jgi:ankyrin repeat protein
MYGGVRVTKQNNIFNLIKNPDATLDDLKKLIDIAPSKLNDKGDDNINPLEWAVKLKRDDMADFLKTKGLKIRDLDKENLYDQLKYNVMRIRPIKELIKDKDISSFTGEQQYQIYKYLYSYGPLNAANPYKNETLNILNERNFFNDISEKHSVEILFDNTNKSNIEIYKLGLKNGAASTILKNGVTLIGWVIIYCDQPDALERIKLLINAGADPKYKNGDYTYLTHLYESHKNLDNYKIFIDAGLDVNTILKVRVENGFVELPLLILAIPRNDEELFNYLIEKGANVNIRVKDNNTPLMFASGSYGKIYYVKKLIEHGAEVNAVNVKNTTALMYTVKAANRDDDLEIIKYLLDHGADKTIKSSTIPPESATDIARERYEDNRGLFKKILLLLGEEEVKEVLWKGSTRSDIEKYDIFFESPYDYSCCPICLEYTERSEACMYMSHDCSKRKHFYHKELYNTYAYGLFEGAPKKVEWCTVCGRVTKNHKHFILSSAKAPSMTIEKLKPEIQAQLDANQNLVFFDNANCIGFGGGGTLEKAARFRRLREYSLELQEDVGKKTHNEAMNELIEEVFNAPLIRNRIVKKVLDEKIWNISANKFPENVRNTRNNNANRNYPNIPFEGTLPTLLPSKDHPCIIMTDDDEGEEDNPIVRFHHERRDGINHDGVDICKNDLEEAIKLAVKEAGNERFGKCWFSQCQAILHPEELKSHISELLYLDYKKKFNKQMAREGGNRYTRKNKNSSKNQSVLHKLDLSEVTCALPNFTKDGKLRRSK